MTDPNQPCPTGKKKYADITAAEKILAAGVLGGKSRRRETRAYRCEACGGWHLTSKPKRGAR